MRWKLCRLGGLELSIHPFFVVFIVLWLLAGLPLQTLFLFVLVLGHEFAHLLAALLCGVKIPRIELFPFGGVGYMSRPLELEPRKEFIVAGAGPAFNLALFAVLWNYWGKGTDLTLYADPSLLSFLLKANLFLFFFNLLPVLPLDGGRLLRASLGPYIGFYRSTEMAASLGRWVGALLVGLGLLLSYYYYLNLSLSLMGIFLYYAAGREQQSAIYIFLRYLLRKERALKKEKVLKVEQLVALDSTTVMEVLKHFRPSRYHQVVVLGRTLRVTGVLSESDILGAALREGVHLPLKRIISRP